MKRKLKRILYVLLVLILIFVVIGFLFFKRFVVTAPVPDFPTPQNTEQAQSQDLDYLSIYPSLDRSFDTEEKKQVFSRGILELQRKLPLDSAVFEMEVAKLVAIADNAHTNVSASGRARRLNAIPLRFHWFADGLYVVLAQRQYDSLLGKRITKINDRSVDVLLKSMESFVGGATTNLKYQSPLMFMSPDQLYGMGMGDSGDSLSVSYENTKGMVVKKFIAADTLEKDLPGYVSERWLHPNEHMEDSNWKAVNKLSSLHFSLTKTDENVHHLWLEDVLYVQVNENFDNEERKIKPYLKDVESDAEGKVIKTIILDLRFNPGGNYHNVRPFIRWADEILSEDQKMYIITGNGTFSAGIITVAIAKHELGDQAVIVGEPAGDNLQFWADGGSRMTLPNSRISVYIWTAWNDWKNGCKDWSKCFWIAIFDGVGVGSIDPEILAPLKYNDFINGKDTMIDSIIRLNESKN